MDEPPAVIVTRAGNGDARELRYQLKQGSKHTLAMTMFMKMAMKIGEQAPPAVQMPGIKMVADADAHYRANPGEYGPGTARAKAIAKAVSGQEDQVGSVLALYDYPTLEQQVSAPWLGGGVASALAATSEFLVSQGKIDAALKSYDSASNPKFAQMALDGGC